MATRIHWPGYGWRLWGAAALLAALCAAWVWGPPWGFWDWLKLAGFPLWAWLNLHRWLEPPLLACSAGGLAVARQGEALCVPLATAEVRLTRGYWALRWLGERRGYRALLRRNPGVDALVEEAQATAHALAAQGQAQPRTAQEAERLLNVGSVAVQGRLYLGFTLGFVAVAAAAVWLQQPLLLLATAAGPVLLARGHRRAVWAPDGLWLVRPGGRAEPIAPHQVVAVKAGASEVAVHTRHPRAPVVRLAAAGPVGLLLRLRDWAGLPPAAPAHPLAVQPLAPEPGAVLPPQGLQICARCGGRVRYEAQEGGHGLAGKERPPRQVLPLAGRVASCRALAVWRAPGPPGHPKG